MTLKEFIDKNKEKLESIGYDSIVEFFYNKDDKIEMKVFGDKNDNIGLKC